MVVETTLENGIRVVTEAMGETRSVSIGVMVAASPRQEREGEVGLAHLVEHMMFQGTSSRSSRDISRMMDESGGQMGGFTAKDYTSYTATVLDDHATYALDLLGDILLNSEFSEEALEREKEVVLREIDGENDIPGHRVHNALKAHVWQGHSLGRAVAGLREGVKGFTREDAIYFMHGHYLPDQVTIAACGHLNHEEIVSQVRDSFWRMLGEKGPDSVVSATFHPGVVVEDVDVNQAYFSIGIPAPAYASKKRYLIYLLNTLLGGGGSSRLYERLREEAGLVYQIDSEHYGYKDAGILVIEGSTLPEYLMDVLTLVFGELEKLAFGRDPVTEEELWKAGMQTRSQFCIASENTHTRMSRLATQYFYFGRHIPAKEILSGLGGVSLEAINGFCQQEMREALGQAAVAVVGPESSETFTEKEIAALLQRFE